MKKLLYFIFILSAVSITAIASPIDDKTCAYNLPLPEDLSLKLSAFSGMEAVDILAELESMPVSSARLLVNKMDRKLVWTLWDIKIQNAYENRAAEIEADPIKKAAFEEALAIAKALREPHGIESMEERININRQALINAFGEEFTRTTFYSIGIRDSAKKNPETNKNAELSYPCQCRGNWECPSPPPGQSRVCYRQFCTPTSSGCGVYWDNPCRGECLVY